MKDKVVLEFLYGIIEKNTQQRIDSLQNKVGSLLFFNDSLSKELGNLKQRYESISQEIKRVKIENENLKKVLDKRIEDDGRNR